MIDETDVLQRLCFHEGIKLSPYYDSRGLLTIGVGRCVETNPITQAEEKVVGDWRHGITKNAAFYLLRNDVARVKKMCKELIPFWKELDDERQYALLDMAFQLGMNGVLKFKKMLSYLAVGNYRQAAEECLHSAYARQTPNRARRIAQTIKTGKFVI